jgi:2-polyprenyl-6-methoxyphenol hydroxylase-like FAD-dependent oxidoreductase
VDFSITMSEELKVDVAIVGGGIAGPAMACALAPTGARVLLVEKSPDPIDTARGDHLQPITCEWLQRWGALDAMWARGAEKRLGSLWMTAEGETVLDAPVDDLDIPHPYYLYLNHELICAALLDVAATNQAFERLQPATGRLTAPDDGQHGLLVSRRDGSELRVSASLIVAADGRMSRLRKSLGIDAASFAYDNPLIVLFAPRTVSDARNEVRAYFSDVGVITAVPRIHQGWKIGFPVARDSVADWRRAGPDGSADYLATHVPALAGIKPELAGVYPVAMVNAAHWRAGNAVLLGDACHALHPGRSQGMNVAMRAVARLTELLHEESALKDAALVPQTLERFEAELKPPMDQRLAENHAWGLEMDSMDPSGIAAIAKEMAAIAASPKKLHAYCLAGTGY